MKNRVMSVVLSIGIILSNFSTTGFVSVAADGSESQNGITDTNKVQSDDAKEPGQVVTDIPVTTGREEYPTVPDDREIITVSKKEDLKIYYGQDPNVIFNYKVGDKPRYSKYFDLYINERRSDWLYDNVKIVFEEMNGRYSVHFVFETPGIASNYKIENNNFTVNIRDDYDPRVDVRKEEVNGKFSLVCNDQNYLIGLERDPSACKVSAAIGDKKNVNYYVRNNDPNSEEYGAVSLQKNYDNSFDFVIDGHAQVANDGIDWDARLTNINPTIEIVAYSYSDELYLTLVNRKSQSGERTCLDRAKMTYSRDHDGQGRKKFIYTYTFNIKEGETAEISHMKATVSNSDNSSSSAEIDVQMYDSKERGYLVVDRKKPTIERDDRIGRGPGRGVIYYFNVNDENSDIADIQYSFDNENWTGKDIHWDVHPSKYKYTSLNLTDEESKGDLYIRAIDKAGNEFIYQKVSGVWSAYDGSSNEEISEIVSSITGFNIMFLNAEKKLNTATSSELRVTDSGNYSRYPLQLRIVTDKNVSFMLDGKKFKVKKKVVDEKETDDIEYYYFDLEENGEYNINIKINGKELPLTADILAAMTKFEFSSDKIVIDNEKPDTKLDRPEFAAVSSDSDNKERGWYNIESSKSKDGILKIEINDDCSGIKSVIVSDSLTDLNPSTVFFNDSDTSAGSLGKISEYDEIVKKVRVELPLIDFKDGVHNISVSVTDNAGNITSGFVTVNNDKNQTADGANKSFTFYTDYTRPKGEIFIDSKAVNDASKNAWFADGNAVKFSFSIKDAYPGVVMWGVNDQKRDTLVFTDGDIVSASFPAKDMNANNNTYNVKAVFYDQAGNSSEEGSIKDQTFYVDTEYPTINNVKISLAPETGAGKVLRILSFGIFANDRVKIIVEASDGEHDIGLSTSAMMISFDGITFDHTMDYDKGKYTYVTPISAIPKSGIIGLKVTDMIGKESTKFTKIEGFGEGLAEDGRKETDPSNKDANNFILEKKAPDVVINLPKGDGVTRDDGQTWYREDKTITITVSDTDVDSENANASGIHNIKVKVNNVDVDKDMEGVEFIKNCAKKDNEKHVYKLSTETLRKIVNEGKHDPEYKDNGHYIITVVAEDNAGNKNEVIKKTVNGVSVYNEKDFVDFYIDDKAPAVEKIDFSIESADGYKDASEFVETFDYGFYFQKDLIATVNVKDDDPTSGLNRIEYTLVEYNNGVKGNTTYGEEFIENGKADFNIPAYFKGQIFVMAYDCVENESAEVTPDLFVVDIPEKHESEEHIEITGMGETTFTDDEGHPLFDRNVDITVKVSDTISGIREIRYSLTSENDVQEEKSIRIENSGYSLNNPDLGDGWFITAMDENIITEVERHYTFSADNNNIQLMIWMQDRSNNESSKESAVFSVDQTVPVINVSFDTPAGSGNCYRGERTATITVIERNFDPARIIPTIQNTFGSVPSISGFTDASKTEHTATIRFAEGDYTFSIAGTDRCDHTANVNYSGGNEQTFRVDLTDPRVSHNFDQFTNSARNSFNSNKDMTLTVTEHNFVPSLVSVRVYRTKAGQTLTASNREDCTSEYISVDKWVSSGDTHTISFNFAADYVYQVVVGGTDASGRAIPETSSPVFEIDKTKPVLKTPKNLDVLVYTNKNTETEAEAIVFEDSNIAKVKYTVVSYQMKINEDKVGYDMAVNSKKFESDSGSVRVGSEFFDHDGIYEVKCVPYDVAGNAGEETTHTFVVQREADFLVYIPDSIKDKHTGLYKFDQTGIRSADFEDIEIISYVTKDKEFSIEIDGVEITGSDLDSKRSDNKINKVDMYEVVVKNSYIAQNFSEDTVDTDLTLNAVAKSGNSSQVITLGHIYIDNVKPMGEYEKGLQDLGFFGGFYGMDSKTLMIEGVSPDIDLNRCEILVNGNKLTFENGGFKYDERSHTISFTINKGYSEIRPTLVDNAGNVNNLAIVKKVYVGNLFVRWWYLFILGGVLLIGGPILFIVMRRKRNA